MRECLPTGVVEWSAMMALRPVSLSRAASAPSAPSVASAVNVPTEGTAPVVMPAMIGRATTTDAMASSAAMALTSGFPWTCFRRRSAAKRLRATKARKRLSVRAAVLAGRVPRMVKAKSPPPRDLHAQQGQEPTAY